MSETKAVEPVAYNPAQAAKRLGLSRSTVDRLIRDGELRVKRARSRILISEDSIKEFLASD